MEDDDNAALSVGFKIDYGSAAVDLKTLDDMIGKGAANAVREFQRIEKASGGVLKLGGATAEVTTFAGAATRELESVRRETNRLEKEGEKLVRQLEREAATFGKTRAEIKAMDAAAKATRLNDLGLSELSGRITAANDNMQRLHQSTGALAKQGQFTKQQTLNLGYQFQDLGIQMAAAAGSSAPLKMAFMALMQQGAQIRGVMAQSGVGVGGLAKHVGTLAMRFAPLALAAGVAYGALTVLTSTLEDRAGLDDYAKGLGLTAEEMKKLGPVSITVGDVITGVWRGLGADKTFDNLMERAKGLWIDFRDTSVMVIKTAGAGILAGMSAAYQGTVDTWRQWPAAIGDVIMRGVNATIGGLNSLARAANSLMGVDLFGQIKALENPYAGAGRAVAASYANAFQREYKAKFAAFGAIGDEIIKASKERIGKKAAEIIGERKGDKDSPTKKAEKAAKEARDVIERTLTGIELPELKLKLDTDALEMVDINRFLDPISARIERIAQDAADAGYSMQRAFGRTGGAIGEALAIMGDYGAQQERILRSGVDQREMDAQKTNLQLRSTIALTGAAKGLFKERSAGYRAMEVAEKALTAVQLVRTAIDVAGGAARMFAILGPGAFAAVPAMMAVMASLGFGGGGGSTRPIKTNTGTGTVLGDSDAKSESVRRAIDALRDVDTLMLSASREMAASLRSIDSQIGGAAALVARTGGANGVTGITEDFKTDLIGSILSKVPLIGGILGGLFGSKTEVTGSGLYAKPQALGSILAGGFDASVYSDVQKTKKFLGITTGTSTSTKYAAADAGLEDQFTLILRSFNDAIAAAAGPLGVATTDIEARLRGFVVDLGKVDLKGLSGTEVQEKLEAIFSATGDRLAAAALPGLSRFQKVGEGAFETLIRVASTVETVTGTLDKLGLSARALGIDAKVGIAGQFESLSAMQSAVDAYASAFYTKEEQSAAQAKQLQGVFASLGMVMPGTIAGFRALVEAQDLTTAAGQSAYATLLRLAPAFAELQTAMAGAKSAADVLAERQDLQRKLYEVLGDTAAIRALDLAKLDASNRELQEQIWAVEAAQEAAKAADELRKAWGDVGTTIRDEIARIRGLTDPTGGASFASAQGAFNAAIEAARGGDLDVAKSLPGLSQALLAAAADAATSRQELDRVRAATAARLESVLTPPAGQAGSATFAAFTTAAAASPATQGESMADLRVTIDELRAEVKRMREENTAGLGAVASNTGRSAKVLERVSDATGGDSIAVGRVG